MKTALDLLGQDMTFEEAKILLEKEMEQFLGSMTHSLSVSPRIVYVFSNYKKETRLLFQELKDKGFTVNCLTKIGI